MTEKKKKYPNRKSLQRIQYVNTRSFLYDHYYRSLTLHVISKNDQQPFLRSYLAGKKLNITYCMIRYRYHRVTAAATAM